VTKRLTHELTYDAPLAAVAAMLRDPAFREAVCERQHVLRSDVQIADVPAGGVEIVVEQVQSASGIPPFAQKIVGEEITIVQREVWTTETLGDVFVSIPGKPGDMQGTLRLEERNARTTYTLDLTIKVGIPLVGGKVEGLISDLLLKALKTENAVGRDYLAS
jgi:hypothetical protein